MTTREDYEHAARAAGIEIKFESDTATWPLTLAYNKRDVYHWNPKGDDGDSRRLEVACFMLVNVNEIHKRVEAVSATSGETVYFDGTDPYAATRDAVFLCAVEAGKRMKDKS